MKTWTAHGAMAVIGALTIGTTMTTSSAAATPEEIPYSDHSVTGNTTGNLVCAVTSTWTYDPGVLLTPRPITITIEDFYSSCESTTDPTLQYGHSKFTIERDASCLEGLDLDDDIQKITWNNGKESYFNFTVSVTSAPGADLVTKTGTIDKGHFAGSTAVTTHAAPALNLAQCASEPGVAQSFAVGTFKIP